MAFSQEQTTYEVVFVGRRHKRGVFGAGLMAGATFSVAMLALYYVNLTSRTLANLVADKLSATMPPQFTEFFIQNIGPLGKQLEFFSVLIGQIVVGGLLGLLLVRIWPRMVGVNHVYRNAFIMLGVVWLVVVGPGLFILDQGFLGSELAENQLPILVSTFALFALFAAALAYFVVRLVPALPPVTPQTEDSSVATPPVEQLVVGTPQSRRTFVTAVTGLFALIGGGVLIGAVLKSTGSADRLAFGDITGTDAGTTPVPGGAGTTPGVTDKIVAGEVTATKDFYHVSKNAVDPTGVGTNWSLRIGGEVNTPVTMSLSDIKAMNSVTTYHTLTCISNPVAGPYISNAQWKAVPLRDLLMKAGVKPTGKRLVFTCADGYTDSIPMDKAMETDTIAAYEMNGAPLPDDHGGPLRMLIPNIYGMKNAKWVQSFMVVTDADYEGFWEKQGWDNIATIHTVSAITSPADVSSTRFTVGQATPLKGYAYAGNRGIQKVEVSTDGGKTWNAATTKTPLSHNAWTLWQYNWTPAAEGAYTLQVRAVDGLGAPQSTQSADTFPAGASGLQTVSVHATKAA